MSTDDWKRRNLFSIALMVLHSFKSGFYIMNYLTTEMKISGKDFIKFMEKSKCPYCDSEFDSNEDLSKHIDRIHGDSGLLEGDSRKL